MSHPDIWVLLETDDKLGLLCLVIRLPGLAKSLTVLRALISGNLMTLVTLRPLPCQTDCLEFIINLEEFRSNCMEAKFYQGKSYLSVIHLDTVIRALFYGLFSYV